MRNTINFGREYDKLNQIIFPTFRGESWFNNRARHWLVTVEKKHFCFARLIHKQLVRIRDIPLDLIVYDVAPLQVHSHLSFIAILNSFRLYHKIANTDEFLTFLLFENIEQKRLMDYFTDEEVIFE